MREMEAEEEPHLLENTQENTVRQATDKKANPEFIKHSTVWNAFEVT
jgi:hypothetical protein